MVPKKNATSNASAAAQATPTKANTTKNASVSAVKAVNATTTSQAILKKEEPAPVVAKKPETKAVVEAPKKVIAEVKKEPIVEKKPEEKLITQSDYDAMM